MLNWTEIVVLVVAVATVTGFANLASFRLISLKSGTRDSGKRTSEEPSAALRSEVASLRRDLEGLQGSYLSLHRKFNKWRRDETTESAPSSASSTPGDNSLGHLDSATRSLFER